MGPSLTEKLDCVLALTLMSHVALVDKSFHLLDPQFPQL